MMMAASLRQIAKSSPCQRDRTEDRRREPMHQPQSKQGFRRLDELIKKRDSCEKPRTSQQPNPASPAIRKHPDQRFEEHPGQGGHRNNHAKQGISRPQACGKERQQRRFAHLIPGADNEICDRDFEQIHGVTAFHLQ